MTIFSKKILGDMVPYAPLATPMPVHTLKMFQHSPDVKRVSRKI